MLPALFMMQIPYFNAPIFLENKTQIGKVEEILGAINNVVSMTRRGLAQDMQHACDGTGDAAAAPP
jgi:rRNA processing protein Gar1